MVDLTIPSPDVSKPWVPSGTPAGQTPAAGPNLTIPTESKPWTPSGQADTGGPEYLDQLPSFTDDLHSFAQSLHGSNEGIEASIPFSGDARAAASATIGTAGAYLRGDQNGPGWRDRFTKAKQDIEAEREASRTAHPYAYGAGYVGGTLANPLMRAEAPVNAIAGAVESIAPKLLGKTIPKVVGSSVMGGGYGAMQGFSEGTSLEERIQNAEEQAKSGAEWGAALPIAIGAGAGTARFLRKLYLQKYNPDQAALEAMAESMKKGRPAITDAEFTAGQQRGQPLVVGDLGTDETRALAREASVVSPEAKQTITDVTGPRYQEQNSRMANFVDGMYGGNLDYQINEDALNAQARAVNDPNYRTAFAQGRQGIFTNKLQDLLNHPEVQDALPKAQRFMRGYAADNGLPPPRNPFIWNGQTQMWELNPANPNGASLRYWDQVKRGLQSNEGIALRSGDNTNAAIIAKQRTALTNELRTAVPAYGTALDNAADFLGAQTAREGAVKYLGLTSSQDIGAANKAMAAYSPLQKAEFERALAGEIKQRYLRATDSKDVSQLLGSPDLRTKIAAGMSPANAQALTSQIAAENTMNLLHRAVTGGSDTRAKFQNLLEHLSGPAAGAAVGAYHEFPGVKEFMEDPLHATGQMATGAAIGAFGGAMIKANRGMNEAVLKSFAQQITSRDPTAVRQAMARLQSQPALQKAVLNAEAAIIHELGPSQQ